MKLLKKTVITMAALGLLTGSAFAACSYDTDPLQNCLDATNDWLNSNSDNQGSGYDDIVDRVDSAGDTVNECISCATETLEQQFTDF